MQQTKKNTAHQRATISLKSIWVTKPCFSGFKGFPLMISWVFDCLKEPDPFLPRYFFLASCMEKSFKKTLSLIKKQLADYRGSFWCFCGKSPWIAAEVNEGVKIIFFWHFSPCVSYSLFAFGLNSPCNIQALLHLRLQHFWFKMVLSFGQKIWNQHKYATLRRMGSVSQEEIIGKRLKPDKQIGSPTSVNIIVDFSLWLVTSCILNKSWS